MKGAGISHRACPNWRGACLLVATVALGAILVNQSPADPAQPAAPPDGLPRIVAKLRSSVVAIGSYDRMDTPIAKYFGTGFVVDDGRSVVTNQHVISAMQKAQRLDKLVLFLPDKRAAHARKATVVEQDRYHDLALLSFVGVPLPALELARSDWIRQGRAVAILGYPLGMQLGVVPAVHTGVVAAIVSAVLPLPKGAKLTPALAQAVKNPYDLIQLDLVVYPGHSGSPLFDARTGKVVGVINKTLAARTREHLITSPSGIGYAVPVRWVDRLIKRAAVSAGTRVTKNGAHQRTSGE